jgi:hypothetical protein
MVSNALSILGGASLTEAEKAGLQIAVWTAVYGAHSQNGISFNDTGSTLHSGNSGLHGLRLETAQVFLTVAKSIRAPSRRADSRFSRRSRLLIRCDSFRMNVSYSGPRLVTRRGPSASLE